MAAANNRAEARAALYGGKRPAKKTARPTARKKIDADGIQPVEISTADAPEVERVVLFRIDGREYTIPRRVPPNVTMKYLNTLRKNGHEQAVAVVAGALIGDEGMDALSECDAVTEEQIENIMGIIEGLVMGQLEATQGK